MAVCIRYPQPDVTSSSEDNLVFPVIYSLWYQDCVEAQAVIYFLHSHVGDHVTVSACLYDKHAHLALWKFDFDRQDYNLVNVHWDHVWCHTVMVFLVLGKVIVELECMVSVLGVDVKNIPPQDETYSY